MEQAIHPERGGTGTSGVPSLNDILIGDGTGKYKRITVAELKTLLGFSGFGSFTVSDTEPPGAVDNDIWVDTN